MTTQPRVNELWKYIGENQVNGRLVDDLTDFKTSQVNYRLTSFDVQTNGVRYLKTLIYNLASQLSPENWDRLRRIENREVGNPFSVTYDGEMVCLDYLRAVLDLEFIEKNVDLAGADVLEIGAGYGRTCHSFLSNHKISSYTIIDLETTMEVSQRYLRTVLDDAEFAKITFIPVGEIEGALGDATFDLAINIDSLAEMDVDTVRYYLGLIDRHCRNFYVNNPVGKYMDKSLDGHARGEQAIARAMSPGLLTDVIDVNDNRAVAAKAPEFTAAYRPHDGWTCAADTWAVPYTWYWQALFQKQEPKH
ncbi:putative sugar O-methyltransferase [Streptomyces sp. NPDC059037]|uniref:putative sugar O-methyltransferase n=1 Tax=Streptomyces sp. NPDC059037 TaxID=3346710 RepID=UPI0036982B4C